MILIFGTLLPGQVQDLGAPIINNYEPEQYKASSQNWVAVQDRRGIMYFGNANGILEFDGQRWQLIPTQGNATIRALTCGADGMIYYGSIGDFGYLTVSPSGKVSAVSLKEAIPKEDRVFNDVWQTLSSRYGIYFLTRSKIFQLEKGKVHPIQGKFAGSQACLLNETVFYADLDKGLCMLDRDQAVPVPQLAGVYNGKRITLAPFGHHQLLVGRVTGDFRRIDLEPFWDETSQRYDTTRPAPKDMIQDFPSELDAFLKDSNASLYKLVPLGPDTFAISTVKAGIITFDRAGKIIRAINKDGGLLDNTVLGLLVDRSNNLWAVSNLGISHIELSVPQSVFGARNGIDGVSNSACFHNDRLYVGTFQNLLVQVPYRYALKDDVPKYVAIKDSPSEVWQLLEAEGDLMAASGLGLFRIQGEAAFKVPGSSPSSLCLGVSRRWSGHLFVGLMGGLEVFKRKSGQWTLVGMMAGLKENIRRITEDANGDLWLSTDIKGLLRAHFSGGQPTDVVIQRFGPEHGLPGLTGLRTMFHGTTLYVLSPKGLFRADIQPWEAEATDQTRFAPDLALGKAFSDPPTALNDMASDGQGGFVFSTSKGATWAFPGKDGKFKMTTRPFQGITSPDDMVYVHPKGGVWLLGRVLHRVDPWAAKDYDQTFDVLLRKVITKSKQLLFEGTHGHPGSAFGQQRTLFVSGQDPQKTPELPYRENALSFEFAAAFYEKPGSMKFQYLLEGFDKEWSDWSAETKKEYTNLPEGKYRFCVRAKNIYGTMGHESSYSLHILAPWYHTWWAYFLWISGGIAALFGIIYLYTLRLRRQKEYLENVVAERTQELEKLSIVASETDNAVMIMDEKANIEWINQGFTSLYEVTLEELLKKSDINLSAISVNSDIKNLIEACLRDKKAIVYETLNVTKSGRQFWAQTTLTPILDDKGNIKKLVTIDSDITKIKEAEAAADKANQSKSEFLSRMSHEIRTPMNGVIGFTDMLLDTELSEEQMDFARTINRSGEALITLLNDILDFSKIEAGELTFDAIDFDPEMTVFDICDLILPRVGAKDVEILCRIGDRVPAFIHCDPGRFRQVIVNLMGNAAKFTAHGEIELSLDVVEEEGKRMKLLTKIRDTGIGIRADQLDHVFEPFKQADGSTTRKYGGTGLGLSICRQISRLMGGDVWVENTPGQGSTFHFTCWVDQSHKQLPVATQHNLLDGRRALIVDDNPTNLEILANTLKLVNIEVVQVGDPKTVIDTLWESFNQGHAIDICIIDIQMPGISGFDLAREIRKQAPPIGTIPLLAFSSSTLSRSRKFQDAGFSGFLPKPIRRRKLIKMVERLLGFKEATTEESKPVEIVTQHSLNEESKHSLHILLAEDNPINLKLARFILEKAGYKLTVAMNGEEAVEKFCQDPGAIDMILMDVQMPKMDGKQATKEIRKKGYKDIPIIAMTAEAMKGDREKCIAAGMTDYIAKPIQRSIFFAMLKKYCLDKKNWQQAGKST